MICWIAELLEVVVGANVEGVEVWLDEVDTVVEDLRVDVSAEEEVGWVDEGAGDRSVDEVSWDVTNRVWRRQEVLTLAFWNPSWL